MSSTHSIDDQKRELAARVVDKILSDASFREAVKNNPDAAMNTEFGSDWNSLLESLNDPEVSGYVASQPIESDSNCCQGGTCVESY